MRGRISFLLIVFGLFSILEIITYFGLKSLIEPRFYIHFLFVYILQSSFILYSNYRVYQGMQSLDIIRSSNVNFMIGVFFTSFITKIVFVGLLLLQDFGRFTWAGSKFIADAFGFDVEVGIPSRMKFLIGGAAMIAAIPFFSLLYGITKGKYKFTTKDVALSFKDLPSVFDGLKVVQISDIHSGSFDNLANVARGVEMINALNPDLILFTGDLVNSDKNEIDPFIEVFASLESKYGKYAVLGNHDYYGVHAKRGSENYEAYMDDFKSKYEQMGFNLLINDSDKIDLEGSSINILGVENWGAGRYFQKYGDLDEATANVDSNGFNILLSHDPTYWEEKVIPFKDKIQLTLSGHTHGMQIGIDIPWMKWSPVKYKYKHWLGLYNEAEEYLYVNRGFGFLGFPGRVGMWPEITQITLTHV